MTLQQSGLSGQDLYALSRAFVGLSFQELPTQNPLVGSLLTELNWSKPEHLNVARTLLKEQLPAILAVDPNGPPPPLKSKTPETAFVPPLLKEARLDDKALNAMESVGHWYKEALGWATQRSPMTPTHFLEAGILWLIGLAVNRRICIEFHERIYPLLYLLIIAETSKYAKSTGMNTIRALVMATMPHMLIPGSTTTEGMIEMLSGQLPMNFERLGKRDQEVIEAGRRFAGQRGVILDEYSSLLGAMKKDYMAGFVELLMRMYDNQDAEQHHTRSGGMIIVKYPGMSIFGATTPAAMARSVAGEMWENGAMARYLMMFRENPLPYNPDYISYVPPSQLTGPLAHLHKSLPPIKANDMLESEHEDFSPIRATITPEAHKQYQAYMKAVYYDMLTPDLDERLHGNYRRMHIQAVKIALALACSDWALGNPNNAITIQIGHFALAQTIVEKARESLHQLMPVLSQSADSRTRKSLISTLKNYPEGLTITEIGDKIGRSNTEIRSSIELLLEAGQIEGVEHKPHTGRPTMLYRFLT